MLPASLQGAKQWSRVAMSQARGERAGYVLSEPRGVGSLPSLARVISYPSRGWCQEGLPVTCCETFLSSSAFPGAESRAEGAGRAGPCSSPRRGLGVCGG